LERSGVKRFSAISVPSVSAHLLMFVSGIICASLLQSVSTFRWTPRQLDLSALSRDALGTFTLFHAWTLVVVAVLSAAVLSRKVWQGRSASNTRLRSDQPAAAVCLDVQTAIVTRTVSRHETVAHVEAQFEDQLRQLFALLTRYLEGSDKQLSSMMRAGSELASATSVDQIRAVVEFLVTQNTQAQSDARKLRDRLEEAQTRASALREQLEKAEELASIDALTSVANRRRLFDTLDREVAKSHAETTPLCLVMADIDFFKKINDSFGHSEGDNVLKNFAQLLSTNVRSEDLVARYGGEEFAIVLPKTPIGNATELIERIRVKIEAAKFGDPRSRQSIGRVTASFGIAAIRDDECSEELMKRADRKLYEAKQNGRNRVEIDRFAMA
jgi:diguanylate cyclase (GGDEF)-like protein